MTLEKAIRQSAVAKLRPDLLQQAIDSGRRTGKLRSDQAEALRAELMRAG